MHLTEYDIACLLDGTLRPARRRELEAHLADCEKCTEAVGSAYRLLKTVKHSAAPEIDPRSLEEASRLPDHGATPPFFLGKAVRYSLAAMLLVGVGLYGYLELRQPEILQFRGGRSAGVIEIISPSDQESIAARTIPFQWKGIPEALQYRLSIYHDDGFLLWKGETTRNELISPTELVFQSGNLYLWKVEAVLPDGTTLSSELHAFRYTP
jgi:hypothetical protein